MTDNTRVSCGWGLQTRNVTCALFPTWPRVATDPIRCSDQPQPLHERLCAVRCGQDCQLGPWETWSSCASSCDTSGVSTRVRRVIVAPSEGGAHCPPRVQRRQCWPGKCNHGAAPVMMPLVAKKDMTLQGSHRHVTVYVGPWSNCSSSISQSTKLKSGRVVRRDISHVKTFQNPRQSGLTRVSSVTYQVPGSYMSQMSQSQSSEKFHSSAPVVGHRTREVRDANGTIGIKGSIKNNCFYFLTRHLQKISKLYLFQ